MKHLYAAIYIVCLTIPMLLLAAAWWFGWRTLYRRMQTQPSWYIYALVLAYPIGWLLLLALQRTAPPIHGPLAITPIILPHLFLPMILLLPFAVLPHTHLLRRLLLGCSFLFVFAFFPTRWSAPPQNGSPGTTIRILNWNVANTASADQQTRLRELLVKQPADIVVLHETYWRWLQSDPEIIAIYPEQFVHATHSDTGLVLLTHYPVLDSGVSDLAPRGQGWARFLWVRVSVNQQSLLVLALHPESPFGFTPACRLLPCFDPTHRDMLFQHTRPIIDTALDREEPLIVVGDLNLTEREAIYSSVTAGLDDAYTEVGLGTGSTWGMFPSLRWGFPLLRIDYILTSPHIEAVELLTDCQLRGSDHCLVSSIVKLQNVPGQP